MVWACSMTSSLICSEEVPSNARHTFRADKLLVLQSSLAVNMECARHEGSLVSALKWYCFVPFLYPFLIPYVLSFLLFVCLQALIWSKKSTGLPIEVESACSQDTAKAPKFVTFCKLDIDINKVI